MPTLTRIFGFLALIVAIIYGAMYALAHLVEPSRHMIRQEIPAAKIKQRVIAPPRPINSDMLDNRQDEPGENSNQGIEE
ncbi:hypothetical protein ACFOLL_08370 [Falsochrobactrum ovis]|uniref:Uncharacterized protein n=1 Tax=Falsochrobactrum ovis TaxID=1293442 RepID=A0A364JYM3_9HYPH|nr:hypothetical protein [Falsochrobactrum ovis]RAK33793.1 hypothetical protein C7374_101116 [Falsochrobactrum ovis]